VTLAELKKQLMQQFPECRDAIRALPDRTLIHKLDTEKREALDLILGRYGLPTGLPIGYVSADVYLTCQLCGMRYMDGETSHKAACGLSCAAGKIGLDEEVVHDEDCPKCL